MPKRYLKRLKSPSLTAWAMLGAQAGEMMLASAQVINHRVGRMAAAKYPLSARDSTEFMRMGTEKMQAAAESMVAMSMGVMSGQSVETLFKRSMKPFHGRAVANAKRLGKSR